jgi:hypothetical protein
MRQKDRGGGDNEGRGGNTRRHWAAGQERQRDAGARNAEERAARDRIGVTHWKHS